MLQVRIMNVMIGLVITAHGDLPFALGSALEHIFGPQTHIRAVSINPDDDLMEKSRELQEAVLKVKGDHGVIITTDLFGGTPSNLALGLTDATDIEVVCGVNLPLLIKILEIRAEGTLKMVSEEAQKAGIAHIRSSSSFFEIHPKAAEA